MDGVGGLPQAIEPRLALLTTDDVLGDSRVRGSIELVVDQRGEFLERRLGRDARLTRHGRPPAERIPGAAAAAPVPAREPGRFVTSRCLMAPGARWRSRRRPCR